MRIWIVNPFDPVPGESFRPGRYATLAEMLLARGHRVTWFTSSFFHTTKSYRPRKVKNGAQRHNLQVIFVDVPPYSGNISIKRVLNHLLYSRRFSRLASSQGDKPDLILASAPPLASAKASIKIAERLGTRCVIDVQDLWPEVYKTIFPDGLLSLYNVLFCPLKVYADQVYSGAFGLSAVSEEYLNRALSVSANGDKPKVIVPLGIDLDIFREVERTCGETGWPLPWKQEGEFLATYVGTIGKSYDIETTIRAAALLKNSPQVKFFFAGGGPQINGMKSLASRLELDNVTFTGLLPFDAMVRLLKESDVGLNVFTAKAAQTFPNKVFDYMAAGLPMINSLKGELRELLSERKIGLQYEAEDERSLAEAIRHLNSNKEMCLRMGTRAREIVEQEFDRRKSYLKYIDFLENAASISSH